MNDRWSFLHLWILMSVLMAVRCRPTLKGIDHKTKKILRPIKAVIPKPFHERSKKHHIFTLAAPPTTASLLPAVGNMVLMPNSVPAVLSEPAHHMFHQRPLDIPYGIPGTLHRGDLYRGLHRPIPWQYYAGLYHHDFPDPYGYHRPALYPVDFPAGFPSYVLDPRLRYNSPNSVFLGARSAISHRSVPAFVNYPKPVVHYPQPHYVQRSVPAFVNYPKPVVHYPQPHYVQRSVPAFFNYPKPVVHYPQPHYVQLNGNRRVVVAPPVQVY